MACLVNCIAPPKSTDCSCCTGGRVSVGCLGLVAWCHAACHAAHSWCISMSSTCATQSTAAVALVSRLNSCPEQLPDALLTGKGNRVPPHPVPHYAERRSLHRHHLHHSPVDGSQLQRWITCCSGRLQRANNCAASQVRTVRTMCRELTLCSTEARYPATACTCGSITQHTHTYNMDTCTDR